jgi:hypothetical protein
MFGEEYEKGILKIPMSDCTVIHICKTCLKMLSHIREANFFAIQLNESTDSTGKVQLLGLQFTLTCPNVGKIERI